MYIVENENIRVEMLKFMIKYLYLINLLEVIFYDAKKNTLRSSTSQGTHFIMVKSNFRLKRNLVHFFSSLEVHCFLAAFIGNVHQIDLLRKSAQKDRIFNL